MKHSRTIISKLDTFFFAPASPLPLAMLRIGLATALLCQVAWLYGDTFDLYGRTGILQGALSDFFTDSLLPGVGTLISWGGRLGLPEASVLVTLGVVYVVGLACMLVGWCTPIAVITVFITHTVLAGGHMTSYGADMYSHIGLFYLMFAPAGAMLSLDHFTGRVSARPGTRARFCLRMLQIQLCIGYFAAGIEKAMGPQWWNGDAIWRSLMLPLYRQFDFSWIAHVPALAMLLGWMTLVTEIGYAFFIWPRRTRFLWVAMTMGMHLGIGIFMGLTFFSIVMCVLTFSAFVVPATPLLVLDEDVLASPSPRTSDVLASPSPRAPDVLASPSPEAVASRS